MGKLDEQPFLCFDAAAREWNRFRCAAVVSEHGDAEIVRARDRLRAFIGQHFGRVWSHRGGAWDFLYLQPGLQSVCLVETAILRAQFGAAHLHDASRLMPVELAEVGAAVGLAPVAMPQEPTDREAEAVVLRRSEVTAAALRAYKAWLTEFGPTERLPTTSGGLAIHLLERLEPETVAALSKHLLDPGRLEEHAAATSGGRVELFRLGRVPHVWGYDLRSSYPTSWTEGPVPIGPWKRVKRLAGPGVYYCRIEQDRSFPPLVPAGHRWVHVGEGWLTSEEITAAARLGAVVEVLHGWSSKRILQMGDRTVRALYPFKRQRPPLPWAKGALVALHGQFARGCEQEMYCQHPRRPDRYQRDQTLTPPLWYQQPLTAQFVFARARLRLIRAALTLLSAGWEVYYLADDCLHTNCPPAAFAALGLVLGDELGNWKLEHDDAEAVYLAPKVYGLRRRDGSTHLVTRGIPAHLLTWERLLEAASGEDVRLTSADAVLGFRQALGTDSELELTGLTGTSELSDAAEATAPCAETYTLRLHAGGKRRGDDGRLEYPEC